ncbi:MAG: creatininase family protein [Thermoplasmata archaeon]|nr:creatininase family protein [Thermoplasmata archaeon]
MAARWDEMTMDEVDALDRERTLLILPVGSIEGHGPHLPVGTDWLTAVEVADAVADRVDGAVVLPGVPYGLCSSTRDFPGTVTITFESLHSLVEDLMHSVLSAGFRRLLVLSSHAGRQHMSALRVAAAEMARMHDVAILVVSDWEVAYELPDVPQGDGHGGMVETARMMAYRPTLVRDTPGKAGTASLQYVIDPEPGGLWPHAYEGDPSAATPAYGADFNSRVADRLVDIVDRYMAAGVR